MLPVNLRLKSPSEFYKLKKFGNKVHTKNFTFQLLKNTSGSKFGFIISKKISPKAFERNRIKRISRSIFKDLSDSLPDNVHIIVFPKTTILNTKYSLLLQEVSDFLKKI